MRLLSASIRRFRNLGPGGETVAFEPGPRATVLFGENGQGKTNTLEALWFAGTLRPLRATRLSELVQSGGGPVEASAEAVFELPGGPRTFRASVQGSERQASVDGKRVASVDDYFGSVVMVAFTPDDLELAKGAPEERRRFLDRAVFELVPAYLSESRDYARALKARNRLVREHAAAAVREAFDEPLVRLGARLWRRRLALVQQLQPLVSRAFAAVGRAAAGLELSYRAAGVALDPAMDEPALASAFMEALHARLDGDQERGFTSVGPHADDLVLRLGDRPVRLYASQGQQRAAVLALKIGEIENLRAQLGRYPLLLLDDVSSELDPARNGFLMEYLRGLETQFLLTTTDPALVARAAGPDAAYLRVAAGLLQPSRPPPAPAAEPEKREPPAPAEALQEG